MPMVVAHSDVAMRDVVQVAAGAAE